MEGVGDEQEPVSSHNALQQDAAAQASQEVELVAAQASQEVEIVAAQASQEVELVDLWEQKLAELQAFRDEHGHCCVSQKSSKKEDRLHDNLLSLGAWVKEQRQQFKKGKLADSRVRQLDALGFTWDGSKAIEVRDVARQLKEHEAKDKAGAHEPPRQVKINRTQPSIQRRWPGQNEASAASADTVPRASEEENGGGGTEDSRPTRKSKIAANDLMYALSLQSQLTNYHIERPESKGPAQKKTSMTRLHLESLYGSAGTGSSNMGKSPSPASSTQKSRLSKPKSKEGGPDSLERGGNSAAGVRAGGMQGRAVGEGKGEGSTAGGGASVGGKGGVGGEGKRKASESEGHAVMKASKADANKGLQASTQKQNATKPAKIRGPGMRLPCGVVRIAWLAPRFLICTSCRLVIVTL